MGSAIVRITDNTLKHLLMLPYEIQIRDIEWDEKSRALLLYVSGNSIPKENPYKQAVMKTYFQSREFKSEFIIDEVVCAELEIAEKQYHLWYSLETPLGGHLEDLFL